MSSSLVFTIFNLPEILHNAKLITNFSYFFQYKIKIVRESHKKYESTAISLFENVHLLLNTLSIIELILAIIKNFHKKRYIFVFIKKE